MTYLKVFENNVFLGYIPADVDTIARYVATRPPSVDATLTDIGDSLVVSTFGNFLNRVPDQQWLLTMLLPAVQKYQYQFAEDGITPVEILTSDRL